MCYIVCNPACAPLYFVRLMSGVNILQNNNFNAYNKQTLVGCSVMIVSWSMINGSAGQTARIVYKKITVTSLVLFSVADRTCCQCCS